jgi:cholesterol oxidase
MALQVSVFRNVKLTIFKHVAVLSGTGVGGGSLVYTITLSQIPLF